MLSDYNIENEAYTIRDKESSINKLPAPFIAHFGGDFVVVTKIKHDKVIYIQNGKTVELTIQVFCQSWSGVVLLAETTKESQEPDYEKHIKIKNFENLKLIMLAVITLLGFIYVLSNAEDFSLWLLLSFILNLSGIYISWLLLQKQMNTQSRFADKICSLFSHSDCNNILETSAAKLFGLIGWSEIGFGYFISNILLLLFAPILIPFYVCITTFSLFYLLWSVWYQKFRAKQWCVLCLTIQMIFLLTFIVNLLCSKFQIPEFSISNIILLICVYLFPTLIISILLPHVNNKNLLQNTIHELNSIKANEDVFRTILTQQENYQVDRTTSGILFGNSNSKVLITIFSNPHCNPCARMHIRVGNLLSECGDNICIQYIFSSFHESLDSSNLYLTAVYYQYDKKMRQQIYNEWFAYGNNKPEDFFENYPANTTDKIVIEQFNKHKSWKNETKLRTTPTILVNGYKLPTSYKIEDLRFLTDFVL